MISKINDLFPIICNQGADIFTIGNFAVKWYSLILASNFILCRYFLACCFNRQGIKIEKVDTIITYVMVGCIVGARLFHVIFYDWHYFSHHILEIFLPFRFDPEFKFTGFSGLASHGVIIGLVVALYMSLRKINQDGAKVRLLWLMDRIAVIGALCSCFVRIGNFMNSELYGDPTDNKYVSAVYVNGLTSEIKKVGKVVERVSIRCAPESQSVEKSYFVPIVVNVKFKKSLVDEESLKWFLEKRVKSIFLSSMTPITENIHESRDLPLNYLIKNEKGVYSVDIYTMGIKRHISQLYESGTYILIFLVLFCLWYKIGGRLRDGVLSGLFLIMAFSFRIFHETLKDGDVMLRFSWGVLNTAQVLSLGIILLGVVIYFWTYKGSLKK